MFSMDDNVSANFTLERRPEHNQEKPVFVVEEQGRDRWSKKIEFLFACIGFCVGYGNMWRFPYMCFKNGGGRYRLAIFIILNDPRFIWDALWRKSVTVKLSLFPVPLLYLVFFPYRRTLAKTSDSRNDQLSL